MIIGCLPPAANGGHVSTLARYRDQALGEDKMRSNSGNDESRNNLHDPTLRDRSMGRGGAKSHGRAKAPADHREGRHDKSPKSR